jgi:hypothetical protein
MIKDYRNYMTTNAVSNKYNIGYSSTQTILERNGIDLRPKIRRFKNEYIIDGNITTIILKQRNGNEFHTMIDTEDLPRLLNYEFSWCVKMHPVNKEWYAFTQVEKENGKKTTSMLQYFIGNPNNIKGTHVDHINHDTLDNRKCNLRISTVSENLHNRKGKNITNVSGYRNVSLTISGKWLVTLRIDGEVARLGTFTDVHEAGEFAEKMRQKYYGEFAGEGIGYTSA